MVNYLQNAPGCVGEGKEPLTPTALSALDLSLHHHPAGSAHVKSEQLESNEFSGTAAPTDSQLCPRTSASQPSFPATRQECCRPSKISFALLEPASVVYKGILEYVKRTCIISEYAGIIEKLCS